MINKSNKTDKFISILTIPSLDDQTMEVALRLFRGYKEDEIISNCIFTDNKWYLTDEYENFGFDFSGDKEETEVSRLFNMSFNQIMEKLKIYVLYKMGTLSLEVLQSIITQSKYVILSDIEEIDKLPEYHGMYQVFNICEFFTLLTSEMTDEQMEIIDSLENIYYKIDMSSTQNQRTLATFDSYFKFDSILNSFWETADEDEKIFFFPVWLWWSLTSVIPTRPREFLLIPRKCLAVRNGKTFLTIRKNNLKGYGKTKSYKITKDYKKMEIAIPKKMEDTIRWYIDKTNQYDDNDLETLLITDPHYQKWNMCRPYKSRFFTYVNLATCLRYFYEQVIHERYGYTIVYERDSSYLSDNEINFIHLGDLRHLALINLIEEGAAPVVAMLLAGQDSPKTASHYYTNIPKLIECRVYRQYKKMIKGGEEYALSSFDTGVLKSGTPTKVDDGFCWSTSRKNNDYSDCMKVVGKHGEIGDCRACRFFRKNGHSFYDNSDWHKKRIETECKMLAKILEDVRKEKGCKEDLITAINRIRTENYSYEQYCLEKEIQNGKSKKH